MDWSDFLLPAAINALLMTIKNPAKAAQWRAAMLKIFRAIKNAYPLDPDFQ
jgi:hypothetical protein